MSAQLQSDPVASPLDAPPRVRPGRTFLLGLCGLFSLWILVMPPFSGSDEFDHAYRAASAARGQWMIDPVNATRGTGAFLHVPADIVDAARRECQRLKYTVHSDCVGKAVGDERIVSSGAGRYHPLFYAVIGTVARPFHGAAALYAMRFATAALAAAFLALALAAASTWARTRWPYVGIAVACTPVALYSSSIAAPNGVEMMSAIALWMSLISLLLAPERHVRRLAVFTGVSGATLATLRPLGPLWCVLAFAVVLLAVRPVDGRVAWLLRRPVVWAGAGLVALSALQSTVWVIAVDALKVGVEDPIHTTVGYRLWISATQLPAWVLQTIAAFPLRKDPSHPSVYACYLLLFVLVVMLGLRAARIRARLAIGAVAVVALLLPYLETVQSFDKYRAAWQGRYGLPLSVGMVLLAALALDRAGMRPGGRLQLAMALTFILAHAVSVVYTLNLELHHSPQLGSSAWVHLPIPFTAVWATVAAALMWWGAAWPPTETSAEKSGRDHVPG